jgi:hypothetical protein
VWIGQGGIYNLSFPKHVLVAVSGVPDAIRANRDHLPRAQPATGRHRISSGLVYDRIILECTAKYMTLPSFFRMFSLGTLSPIRELANYGRFEYGIHGFHYLDYGKKRTV